MQIPRLDDHEIFGNIIESIMMLGYFLFNVAQIGLLLVCLTTGSVMGKMSSVCSSTWDRGMEMAGRRRVIMDRTGTKPYMIRYYLLFRDRGENARFNIFIHKIMKSDEDDLHDHPWGYFTFILSGGYWETVADIGTNGDGDEITGFKTMRHWRGQGFMQKVDDTHIHRLELKKDEDTAHEIPCWSLFVPFKRSRDWGFYTVESEGFKWKSADEYNKEKTCFIDSEPDGPASEPELNHESDKKED